MQSPLPTQEALATYYESSFSSGMYQEFAAARLMKEMTARQRISEIKKHVDMSGRWLDVGCANGVFVETIAQHGIQGEGVEISQTAVAEGRARGLSIYQGTMDDVPANNRYDCVTAFDVLEHVIDPNAFLESLRKSIRPGGSLVMTVPNTGSLVRKTMGSRWYFYIPEEHLHYFNSSNLPALLRKHQFEIQNVGSTYKPMTYDYALTQFHEYNPLIYRALKTVAWLIPATARKRPLPLPIGELRVIAKKL
ncbi:MAG: class I SAM-dependent methyltransferase [Pirellulaceae bacterium]|nr:class I SAM-dependent methyltransferase [Pirellulaceae bacterium]